MGVTPYKTQSHPCSYLQQRKSPEDGVTGSVPPLPQEPGGEKDPALVVLVGTLQSFVAVLYGNKGEQLANHGILCWG